MNNNSWFITGVTDTPALRKLDRLSDYPKGWAHGDGDQFLPGVAGTARWVLTIADSLGLDRTDVFPRRDGGLVVSVYVGSDTHDFTVHADGSLEWLHEIGDVELECQPITFAELQTILVALAKQQWHSYAYWSQTITIPTVGASRVLHSPPQASIGQFPVSTWIAPISLPAARAGT